MSTLSAIVFAIGTVIIVGISRRSLLMPRSHGFYRFFAWEGILGLIVLNAPYWIHDPLSFRQICSWLLLTASIYPVAHGIFLLQTVGKPAKRPAAGTDYVFEQTTHLVSTGIYKYIRHPLYASLLFLAWGTYFKEITLLTTALTVAVTMFLVATAKTEEKENIAHFGERYTAYASKTKMFIPYIW